MNNRTERSKLILLTAGILLVAANLRAALTSVGPVVGQIRADTGISNAIAGMLTTFGLFAFAVVSPVAPKLARRFGTENVLTCAMAVITVGIIIRSLPFVAALFAGTALIGLAIGVGNVLVPSLIKRDFPTRKIGLMTGVYSVSMTLWAGIASGVTIPIANAPGFGWRGALAVWGLLSAAALVVWLPQVSLGPRADRPRIAAPAPNLWKSGLAWQVTLYMGFQSIVFYVNVAWLPEILHDGGMDYATAGWMLSLVQIVSLPATFLAPIWAGRSANQRVMVTAVMGLLVVGYLGLLGAGAGPWVPVWIVLIGLGSGASFSLALVFFSLRTRSAEESSELSGMAQSVGYLVAGVGPALLGFVHDRTGSWQAPLVMMVVIVLLALLFGLGAGRDRAVVPPAAPRAAE
ncbi:CynX/NimT family MFS transporter [Cohnella nanjingensis]|uniref:MFS transporter n=1 Tax=Cohnella nanjingensis TaxID=1387779 RepID=A0A7X0RZL6_9BACL|nr:MFS transporter [Cohnella nanjingensis]MBB6675210.1 MFS transporter [Cohnella nanjingensis]